MRVLGVTGGIGTGKSTVLDLIQNNFNAKVVQADKVGHQVMEKGMPAYNSIVSYFGENILDENGSINRKTLGGIVFNNKEKLEKLNSFIHPAVRNEIIKEIEFSEKNEKYDFFIIEAALLIEAGYKEICEKLIYIYADENIRRKRLKAGRNMTDEKISEVISNQLSDDEYKKNCDYLIDNSKTEEDTLKQLKDILAV